MLHRVAVRRIVLAAFVLAALWLRWTLVDVASADYRTFLLPWYTHLADSGGFAGLGDSFSNYNTPYLALLAALTYLPVPPLVGIKAISVVFDLLLAFFAYRIVRQLRPDAFWVPTVITGVVLFLPTVVMNGSAWGQCDAIYAALCLGSLSFLLERRPWLACVLFGVAFAFKLQAIFFLPVLVAVLVVNRMRLRALLGAPFAFFAMLGPALLAGRSLASQLAVYPAQITGSSQAAVGPQPGGGRFRGGGGFGGGSGGGGGGARGGLDAVGTGHPFTYNAPTPYAWLPSDAGQLWLYVGLGVVVAIGIAFGVWLLLRRRPLLPAEIVLVAATVTLVVPILLPQMHERYFYLAEVLLVIALAADKRMVLPALGIQLASVLTYLSYLGGHQILPLEWTAVIAVGATAAAAVLLILRLRPAAIYRSQPPSLSGRENGRWTSVTPL